MAKASKSNAPDETKPAAKLVSKYRQVIDILTDAKQKVNDLLTEAHDEMHRIMIDNLLTRASQHFGLVTGTGGIDDVALPTLGPATTIGGKPLGKVAPVRKADVTPKDEQLQVLQGKVESLYDQFLSIDSKELLLKYEDLVIRGVAKKAHLKVTKDEPETLDLPFIETIKDAILEADDLKEKAKAAEASGPKDEELLENMGGPEELDF